MAYNQKSRTTRKVKNLIKYHKQTKRRRIAFFFVNHHLLLEDHPQSGWCNGIFILWIPMAPPNQQDGRMDNCLLALRILDRLLHLSQFRHALVQPRFPHDLLRQGLNFPPVSTSKAQMGDLRNFRIPAPTLGQILPSHPVQDNQCQDEDKKNLRMPIPKKSILDKLYHLPHSI